MEEMVRSNQLIAEMGDPEPVPGSPGQFKSQYQKSRADTDENSPGTMPLEDAVQAKMDRLINYGSRNLTNAISRADRDESRLLKQPAMKYTTSRRADKDEPDAGSSTGAGRQQRSPASRAGSQSRYQAQLQNSQKAFLRNKENKSRANRQSGR